jgi:hypothetical protein
MHFPGNSSGKTASRRRLLLIAAPLSLVASLYLLTAPTRTCIATTEARLTAAEYRDVPNRAFEAALVICRRQQG